MKCFCITTLLYSILFVFYGCTRDNMMDSMAGAGIGRVPLVVRATASCFDNLPISEKPVVRAPTESGFETQFNTGDAIGIFAIKDGAIFDAINNMKLTYSVIDGIGNWTPPTNTMLYWYDGEGVRYIAYYPYKEGISIDSSRSDEEIIKSLAADPLLQPQKDQSDAEKYTASDLMTAIGTLAVDESDSYKKILSFSFKHQFTLLVLKPQVHVGCFAPANAGFEYRNLSTAPAADYNAKNVMMNDVKACRMDDGSYRAIVLPKDADQINGSYVTTDVRIPTDKTVKYSGSTTSFVAGNSYTLKVNSLLPGDGSTTRELAPGDFVFYGTNGIEVYPGDGLLEADGKIPGCDEAVGMVITCDPDKLTDPECKKRGWNHAYVMGLDNIGDGKWGVYGINEPIQEMPKSAVIEKYMNGYSDTEAILGNHINDIDNYSAFKLIMDYRGTKSAPNYINCSPWFIPSIGQWFDMLVNICGRSPREFRDPTDVGLEDHVYGTETLNKLKAQLAKVGKDFFDFSSNSRCIFICSTEYDADLNWILIWHIGDPNFPDWDRVGIKGFDKSSSYHVRPFFAF